MIQDLDTLPYRDFHDADKYFINGRQVLRQENKELQRQVENLRKDRGAMEKVARDELGLVRPEDIVFLFE